MPAFDLSSLALNVIVLAIGFAVAWVGATSAERRRGADRVAEASRSEQSALRQISTASFDLRSIALLLHGNAGMLASIRHPQAADIRTAAADAFEMADDLHAYTQRIPREHVIEDDTIDLGPALREAMVAVNASMGPGRRAWQLPGALANTRLRADRRAIRHILTRTLSEVIRNTGHDARIAVKVENGSAGLVLTIADEVGSPSLTAPALLTPMNHNSRSMDARLLLARSLMLAHGGYLEAEAGPHTGISVSLVFPSERVAPTPVLQSAPASRSLREVHVAGS